jgi:chloramphenicol 3-O phosphotransferase
MRRTVAVLADAGFDLVVDDVWLDGEPQDYGALLTRHHVLRIGLTAPLDVLVAREAARSDRLAGLSRAQHERVHRGVRYDAMLDTSAAAPEAIAMQIAGMAGL